MWEMMWSWWWIRPLPTAKTPQSPYFISEKKSKNNNNNPMKKWLRRSLRRSKPKPQESSQNISHLKYLYESKAGQNERRKSANFENECRCKKFNSFQYGYNRCEDYYEDLNFNSYAKMTAATVQCEENFNNYQEPDSDGEDDPGKLLNVWLGQLNQKDLGSPTTNTNGEIGFQKGFFTNSSATAPVVKRRQQNAHHAESTAMTNLKNQYRCSLINLEETQDDELDAILGELSVLESQFEEEIASSESNHKITNSKQPSPVASVASNSDSSNSSSKNGSGKKRTDSPDTDSAFCDNLSVLSSCSTSSRTDGKSSSGISSATSTPNQEEQEAKIKAEKIKLAIEKIKEANIKKIFIKVFTSDGSAKSLLVDEKMSVNHVTRILAEKNHVKLDPRWTLVELIPDLYMERVYEDHENLVENCLMWTVDSKNTLWFIERPEKYDVFVRPERYLLGSSSSQQGDTMEDHARQELLEEYFSSSGVGAPEMEGYIWLKADSKKSWKKFYFVLRTSGLYYAPKGKKSSKDLVCLATFDVNQVYYGAGWKKKYKAPTDYCFAIKHPKIQAKTPKYMRYLCVDTEMEMHQWVTGIRVAKNGKQLFTNYRSIEEDITHADIDILTSKRFSANSLQINGKQTNISSSPARTPSSENKSLDSALSSGIVSDMSNANEVIEVTPVNTMDRQHSGQLRRSMSKASSTSSSSGCLSDRCSTASSQMPSHPMGFESDFPMGGTIKKRPSTIAKLPLTNITRGLVRDSDEDSLSSGDNVRVGGGGTLLRSAVRASLRKNSLDHQEAVVVQHNVRAQVHMTDYFSEQAESELNCLVEEELPPPPRAESIAEHLNSAAELPTPVDLDDLPPPPPELRLKPPKRISFDDDVQVIGISEPDIDIENERKILTYLRQPYQADPKKLFSAESKCQAAPKKEFLMDLQKVMDKKWQISEKCKVDTNTSPHQVLGFRDNENLTNILGSGQDYTRDESVGAWVLHSQQYAKTKIAMLNQQLLQQEPLYAVCSKSNGLHHNSPKKVPTPIVPPVVLREPMPDNFMYPPHHMANNRHCPQPNLRKKPPPPAPPRRSETTHLTSSS